MSRTSSRGAGYSGPAVGADSHRIEVQAAVARHDQGRTASDDVNATWGYDKEGRLTSTIYPAADPSTPPQSYKYTYSFTFTDTASGGWHNLQVVDILINSALNGQNACYLAYTPATNTLYLVDDAGDGGFAGSMPLTSSDNIYNSQCTLLGPGTAANPDGNTLTITIQMTFKPTFAGNRILYLAAVDTSNNSSGWQPACGEKDDASHGLKGATRHPVRGFDLPLSDRHPYGF